MKTPAPKNGGFRGASANGVHRKDHEPAREFTLALFGLAVTTSAVAVREFTRALPSRGGGLDAAGDDTSDVVLHRAALPVDLFADLRRGVHGQQDLRAVDGAARDRVGGVDSGLKTGIGVVGVHSSPFPGLDDTDNPTLSTIESQAK